MSDQLFVNDPSADDTSEPLPHVLKWRRNGDAFEGLVGRKIDHTIVAKWVPALPVPHRDLGFAPDLGPDTASRAEVADEEEERTRSAIATMFEQYGQYHEVVDETDIARVEIIGRAGRAAAKALGRAVGTSAVRQKDGFVRVCLWLSTDPYED